MIFTVRFKSRCSGVGPAHDLAGHPGDATQERGLSPWRSPRRLTIEPAATYVPANTRLSASETGSPADRRSVSALRATRWIRRSGSGPVDEQAVGHQEPRVG